MGDFGDALICEDPLDLQRAVPALVLPLDQREELRVCLGGWPRQGGPEEPAFLRISPVIFLIQGWTARSEGVEVRITPGEGRIVLVHNRMIVGPALDQETLLSPPSVANGIDNPASR